MRTPHDSSLAEGVCRKAAKQRSSKGFRSTFVLRCFAAPLLCVFIQATLALAAHAVEPLHFPSVPFVPPSEAGKTFEVLHGFQMQLIAAEPLVTSPVAITYDEDGRAFVCEMNDY